MAYTTINKSTDYFNTLIYTGNGSSPRSITGVGFRPDLVWTKDRSDSSTQPWHDVVRGATYAIRSDSTVINTNTAAYGYITSFDSDGYTFQQGSSDIGRFNDNSNLYVSWNWKAGNSQGSSNTDGSINTTYTSVNTTAGFSISQYTGTGANATVGHGLGVAPSMIIIKNLGATQGWCVYHNKNTSAPETDFLSLNSTDATVDAADRWNDTAPTSSVFSVGTHADTNGSSATYIAYCFAEKIGYSKFGSYTGNGSLDGTFIYTGFKPAWGVFKRTNSTGNWIIMDNKRSPFNEMQKNLFANVSDAEDSSTSYNDFDFLSNGIKIREDNNDINASGSTYIYMAFAEAPLVGTNNIPCTAR